MAAGARLARTSLKRFSSVVTLSIPRETVTCAKDETATISIVVVAGGG